MFASGGNLHSQDERTTDLQSPDPIDNSSDQGLGSTKNNIVEEDPDGGTLHLTQEKLPRLAFANGGNIHSITQEERPKSVTSKLKKSKTKHSFGYDVFDSLGSEHITEIGDIRGQGNKVDTHGWEGSGHSIELGPTTDSDGGTLHSVTQEEIPRLAAHMFANGGNLPSITQEEIPTALQSSVT